jgi:uncharacterized membrane protein YdjX (TVP38/TMEM64 family)
MNYWGWMPNPAPGVLYICTLQRNAFVFAFCRHLLRESVTCWLEKHKIWEAIDRAIQRDGWQLAFLLRLAPSINCTLLNYALSLTAISFAQYFVVSVLAIIPGICLFVYVGSVAKNIGDAFSEKDGSNTCVCPPLLHLWSICGLCFPSLYIVLEGLLI